MNCPKCAAKTFNVPKLAAQAKLYVFKKCKACGFLGVFNLVANAWFKSKEERNFLRA